MYIERDVTMDELITELRKGIRKFKSIDVVDFGDLSNWDLQGISFDECFLTGINFSKSNLKNARFIHTNPKHVVFEKQT